MGGWVGGGAHCTSAARCKHWHAQPGRAAMPARHVVDFVVHRCGLRPHVQRTRPVKYSIVTSTRASTSARDRPASLAKASAARAKSSRSTRHSTCCATTSEDWLLSSSPEHRSVASRSTNASRPAATSGSGSVPRLFAWRCLAASSPPPSARGGGSSGSMPWGRR